MQLRRRHALGALLGLVACGPDPQLETFGFGTSAPTVVKGANLGLIATALDASGETVTVTAFVTSDLNGRPTPIGERNLVLQSGPSPQRGTLDWSLGEDVFRFEGRSRLHFEATLGDRKLATTPLSFEVVPKLESMTVHFESPFPGPDAATVVPADAELSVTIEGEYLAGRREVLFEVYNVADSRLLDRQLITPTTDASHVRFQIPPGALGAQTSGSLRVEASIDGAPKKEATIAVQTEGVYGCGFFDASGRLFPPDSRASRGSVVELRVYAFGLDDRAVTIDMFEDDNVEDDFYARFATAVLDGIATDSWTAEFIDDGFGDGVDEFKFRADLGAGHTCDSALLEVSQ